MRRPILVINDDPSLRSTLETSLSQAGFEVASAADGRQGIAALHEHAPCWVLLDLDMPVMDGFEFLTALRRVPFAPRVFVLTDVEEEESRKRALRLGAEHYFSASQGRHPGFGIGLRRALGLPDHDELLPEREAA